MRLNRLVVLQTFVLVVFPLAALGCASAPKEQLATSGDVLA